MKNGKLEINYLYNLGHLLLINNTVSIDVVHSEGKKTLEEK